LFHLLNPCSSLGEQNIPGTTTEARREGERSYLTKEHLKVLIQNFFRILRFFQSILEFSDAIVGVI
jgi:hypothetical protein